MRQSAGVTVICVTGDVTVIWCDGRCDSQCICPRKGSHEILGVREHVTNVVVIVERDCVRAWPSLDQLYWSLSSPNYGQI